VTLIHPNPPPRPDNVVYVSIRELYLQYEHIFLSEGKSSIVAPCGHTIFIFDHHFFHLAAVSLPGKEKLFMRDEKEVILATTDGFSNYAIGHGGSRAKNLRAAYETLATPDEVWANNPKTQSRWVYVKEYAAVPYPFSVALVTYREGEAIIVPTTGFPCKKGDVRKWRMGNRIYP
jgi:phage-Barnase-EndoU-ColicinE5/D-RelE like nuclease2